MSQSRLIARRTLHIVKLLYTPVSLLFIVYFAYTHQELLEKMLEVADFRFIFISTCLWGMLHLIAPISPRLIFSTLGNTLRYRELLSIHISRLPARYLPGGIWHTVGRLSAYYSHGVPRQHLTLLALVETFSPCVITLLLGGGYLWLTGEGGRFSVVEGLLAVASLGVIGAAPLVIRWRMPSHWGRNLLVSYTILVLISIFFWIIASTAFLFYYTSVTVDIGDLSLLHTAATYIFSWGIGYISFFAPQGIGVFEVVAGTLLPLPMTLGGAVAFLAGFRVVALATDSMAWIMYQLYRRILSRAESARS